MQCIGLADLRRRSEMRRMSDKKTMSPREKSVADLMRSWRSAAGLSTEDAGKRLNLSRRTIEDIELGRSRADDMLARIALNKLIEDANSY
jgi:ribosome-binding protein aMBF1 (putative translation factor)